MTTPTTPVTLPTTPVTPNSTPEASPATPTVPASAATSPSTPAGGQPSNENLNPAGNAAPVVPGAPGDTGTPATPPESTPASEGFEIEAEYLDQEELDAIAAEASRLKLSQADTQKLVDLAEGAKKKTGEAASPAVEFKRSYDERIANDHKTITADPIFSDAHKEATALSMTRAVEVFGSPELAAELLKPELGNNIHIARFLKKIGDLLQGEGFSGNSVPLGGGPASPEAKEAAMRARYPSMFNADGTPKK